MAWFSPEPANLRMIPVRLCLIDVGAQHRHLRTLISLQHTHPLSHAQDLSNLLVEEDKAEECLADVLSELELLQKQARLEKRRHLLFPLSAVAAAAAQRISPLF